MAKKKAAPKARMKTAPKRTTVAKADRPSCGLCGKTKNLTKTECCSHWICDDEENYVMFSYSHNSCHRNHRRYTLCSSHLVEDHEGRWQDCAKCRKDVDTEMYVYYGTNEYNFEKLEDPPAYKPTKCRKCGKVIRLAEDGYVQSIEGITCMNCSNLSL